MCLLVGLSVHSLYNVESRVGLGPFLTQITCKFH